MNRQADRLLGQARKNREISARRNAFFDIFRAVSGTASVRLWMEILSYLRRFRMLRMILQIIGWVVTLLRAGTLIVLTTIVFFVLLPLLAVLLVIVPLTAAKAYGGCRKHSPTAARSCFSSRTVL